MAAPLDHQRPGLSRSRSGTSAGRLAARAATAAVLMFAISVVLAALVESHDDGAAPGVLEVVRVVGVVLFWACGLATLVLAARAWRTGDRSVVVAGALVLGGLVALLVVAELTFME